MDRAEAEALCRRHGREHPDRNTHRWMAREQPDGSFALVKLRMPPGMRVDPLTTTTESKPKPPQPDDPRTNIERNIGGNWIG